MKVFVSKSDKTIRDMDDFSKYEDLEDKREMDLQKEDDVEKGKVVWMGRWQPALRSRIKGQMRRQYETSTGKVGWKYLRTKSNKYQGVKPKGEGWKQVGHSKYGGHRKESDKSDDTVMGHDGKYYEYWYPSKEHAERARSHHVGKILSSDNAKDAMDHLHHMHGARKFKRQVSDPDKSPDPKQKLKKSFVCEVEKNNG